MIALEISGGTSTATSGYVGQADADSTLTLRSALGSLWRSSSMVLYEVISSLANSMSLNICSKLCVKPAPHSTGLLVDSKVVLYII